MRSVITQYKPLAAGILLLFALLAFRMIWHASFHFAFLVWNVFLAILPLCFAHAAVHTRRAGTRWCCAILWLLFFPNSAYLLTDIVHLRTGEGPAFWLDLVLLFGGGLYGVVIGLRSLRIMETWYGRMLPAGGAVLLTASILMLSGYGIYLGRIERWNSWDVLANPDELLFSIAYELRHPVRCLEVWVLSAIFAAALGLGYLAFRRTLRL